MALAWYDIILKKNLVHESVLDTINLILINTDYVFCLVK